MDVLPRILSAIAEALVSFEIERFDAFCMLAILTPRLLPGGHGNEQTYFPKNFASHRGVEFT